MSEIKNLGQLLNHLASKAGVSADDQNLKNLLSNSELSKITLHSDLVSAIDNNLLSITAATDNHPEIKKVYNAQALNAFDKRMEEVMSDAGLDDEEIEELKGVKSSYKRFEQLTAKLKEKKKEASAPADKSALQKQIDDLLEKAKSSDAEHQKALEKEVEKFKREKTGFELYKILNGKKTVYDTLPPKAKEAAIRQLIDAALQDKDAVLDFDDTENFIIRKSDGSNLVGANHTKYDPSSFIDEVLAQNKVLVVTTTQQNQPTKDNPATPTTVSANQEPTKGNNQIAQMNREARMAIEGGI